MNTISRGGRPVVGFGQAEEIAAPVVAAAAHTPMMLALAGGMAAAATGWAIEEVWSTIWGRRRHR